MMYYSANRLLSHNCLFNFIVSQRGDGKTYDFKKRGIKRFIKNHEQFIYVRRYKTELKEINKFFNDIKKEFPDYEFKIEGSDFYCRKKPEKEGTKWKQSDICGGYIALTTALTKKSVPYPDVTLIGFDEFITNQKSFYRYLPNEVKEFLDLYNTIARDRDVIVIFMANSISTVNPYFIWFKVMLDKDTRFLKPQDEVCVEYYTSKEYVEHVKQTRFGKLIKGSDYEKYAVDNEFVYDIPDFIERRPKTSKLHVVIRFNDRYVGIWADYSQGKFYASEKYDPTFPIIKSLKSDDYRHNTSYVTKPKDDYYISAVMKAFENGYMYYETIDIKSLMFDVMKTLSFK